MNRCATPLHQMLQILCACLLLCAVTSAGASPYSPVRPQHLEEIRAQFREHGLHEADVAMDAQGRITLTGTYADRQQVDLAFSLAQITVGVRWVSPVTPENIRVHEWQKKIGDALTSLVEQTRRPPSAARPDRPATPSSPSAASAPAAPDAAPGPTHDRYALVVGIGTFQEPKINRLAYASRDARLLYATLVNPAEGGFPAANVTLLLDAQATRARIQAALDELRAKAMPDDLVIVYFSSHGSPPDINGLVNVVTYDTVVKPRQQIWSTSINGEILGDFIRNIPTRRLVVVLDTCYSSGAFRKVEGFLPRGGKGLLDEDEAVGISKRSMARLLGAKDLVTEEDAPPAPNVAGGWGKVLISASDNDERSWESERLKYSFFTYFFVEGLRRTGDVRSAFQYAKPRVTQAVQQEKQEQQSPQATASTADWGIRLRP